MWGTDGYLLQEEQSFGLMLGRLHDCKGSSEHVTSLHIHQNVDETDLELLKQVNL